MCECECVSECVSETECGCECVSETECETERILRGAGGRGSRDREAHVGSIFHPRACAT